MVAGVEGGEGRSHGGVAPRLIAHRNLSKICLPRGHRHSLLGQYPLRVVILDPSLVAQDFIVGRFQNRARSFVKCWLRATANNAGGTGTIMDIERLAGAVLKRLLVSLAIFAVGFVSVGDPVYSLAPS
jgi:hypothetical protein